MKLVIAGEYAVLEPGTPGVVAAIDRYATCTAEAARSGVSIAAPGLAEGEARADSLPASGEIALRARPERDWGVFAYAARAADLAYRYVAEIGLAPRPLALRCESEAGHVVVIGSGERAKLGLGTSAATAVAVTGAILGAHGVPIDRPVFRREAFRLALVAHTRAQGGRGSGIDVAASAQGGLIEYVRADSSWQRRMDRPATTALDVARGHWPGMKVEPLPLPPGLRLLAGFTGASVPTPELLARVETWRRERQGEYQTFVRLSQDAARGLARALKRPDPTEVRAHIRFARKALEYLGSRAGVEIETPPLERLATIAFEAGGAGKLSGAGGGDCGIALAFDDATARRIEEGWRAEGITPIPVAISPVGMHEVRGE